MGIPDYEASLAGVSLASPPQMLIFESFGDGAIVVGVTLVDADSKPWRSQLISF